MNSQTIEKLQCLPHLNTNAKYGGVPFYPWMRKYYQSGAHINLLTSANQVGKSSINIRKMINWATNPDIWHKLWPLNHKNVSQFWYLYPTLGVATIEFNKKWIKEWMPRGIMKDDPQYGWEAEYYRKEIKAIHWNSGVTTYFKSYAQNATDLQSGTVHAIFCDEELPISIYDELSFRTSATDGHFHMVFTATLGQYEWECAMEKVGTPEELFKNDSCKIQVSLFDCMEYEDGSASPWTEDRIQKRIEKCSSESEVQKRVYGKFIQDGGLEYSDFLTEENMLENWSFNPNGYVYGSVDPGSGGEKGHPTGMTFLWVNKEYTEGVLFLGWRGDKITTTQADALDYYIRLRGEMPVTVQSYDYHAKDFFNFAQAKGESFQKAEKSHEIGNPILKSLLKFNALKIVVGTVYGLEQYDCEYNEGELLKLVAEFRRLKKDEDKRKAKDDLIDTARYNCAIVPWNWDKIMKDSDVKKKKVKQFKEKTDADRIRERREQFTDKKSVEDEYYSEIAFWNEMGDV